MKCEGNPWGVSICLGVDVDKKIRNVVRNIYRIYIFIYREEI